MIKTMGSAGSRASRPQRLPRPKQVMAGLATTSLLVAFLLLIQQPHTSSAMAGSPTHQPTAADQSSGSAIDSSGAGQQDADELAGLVPSSDSLFKPEQLEPEELEATDCHMRNMDICYAGLLSSGAKPMPTSNGELETRCDELRLTASCLAIFNKRCHTFKVFSLLAPATQLERMSRLKPMLQQQPQPQNSSMSSQAAASSKIALPNLDQLSKGNLSMEQTLSSLADLQTLCDPASAKQGAGNTKSVRQNFFRIAKCINERASSIKPCIEDLKTALQLFFEPQRKLPMNATCCASLRFKECSTKAVDNLCGFGSYEQLEKILASASGASTQIFTTTMNRVCDRALRKSPNYCAEVLPPSGMQIGERRGRKASKLAKVLGLFSMGNGQPDAATL